MRLFRPHGALTLARRWESMPRCSRVLIRYGRAACHSAPGPQVREGLKSLSTSNKPPELDCSTNRLPCGRAITLRGRVETCSRRPPTSPPRLACFSPKVTQCRSLRLSTCAQPVGTRADLQDLGAPPRSLLLFLQSSSGFVVSSDIRNRLLWTDSLAAGLPVCSVQ